MTTQLAAAQDSAYQLETDLRILSARPSVQRVSFAETAQEEALLNKLGVKGWGRVQYFRNHFDAGWGEHGLGRVLSPRAFQAFLRFVEVAEFPANGSKPSVFLTDAGGIELCWEDGAGLPVQVEFGTHGAEYFVGSTGEEGLTDYTRLPKLAEALAVKPKRNADF
jgi:hypothetical protein